jgi:hypothetical protein
MTLNLLCYDSLCYPLHLNLLAPSPLHAPLCYLLPLLLTASAPRYLCYLHSLPLLLATSVNLCSLLHLLLLAPTRLCSLATAGSVCYYPPSSAIRTASLCQSLLLPTSNLCYLYYSATSSATLSATFSATFPASLCCSHWLPLFISAPCSICCYLLQLGQLCSLAATGSVYCCSLHFCSLLDLLLLAPFMLTLDLLPAARAAAHHAARFPARSVTSYNVFSATPHSLPSCSAAATLPCFSISLPCCSLCSFLLL